jgi:hypothetical protein
MSVLIMKSAIVLVASAAASKPIFNYTFGAN